MQITDNGRLLHAQAMASQTFHLAWGGFPPGYQDPWTVGQTPPSALSAIGSSTLTRGNSGNLDAIPQAGVLKIVSIIQGGTTYVQGTSFQLTGNSVDWSIAGVNPKPTAGTTYSIVYRYTQTAQTQLMNEVGRRVPLLVGYANADVNGTIVANGSSWTYTSTPTPNLYLQFKFDPADGVGSIISQVGLFIGTTYANGVSTGTPYVTPNQINSPGQLYMIDNNEPYSRFAGKREVYEYIVSY